MATITDISNDLVDRAGGSQFIITGTGFSKAVQVYFVDSASRKIPASRFTIVSDSQINGVYPAFSSTGNATVNVTVGEDATPAKVAASTGSLGINARLSLSPAGREYANEFSVIDRNSGAML